MTNVYRALLAAALVTAVVAGASISASAEDLTLQGRLVLKQHGTQDEFVALHSPDGAMYRLSGKKDGELKKIMADTGAQNLVTLTGALTGNRFMPCSVQTGFEYNQAGEQQQKIDTVCIPYAEFAVSAIVKSETSDQAMAEPKRDAQAEQEIRRNASVPTANRDAMVGEIVGTIKKVDLYSTVKSVKIKNRDRKSGLKEIVLLLGEGTQVVKKIGMAEPVVMTVKSLAAGQEVTAVYARDDLRSTAKVITITKE